MDKKVSISSVAPQHYSLFKNFVTCVFDQHVAPSYTEQGCKEFHKILSAEHLSQAIDVGALIKFFLIDGEIAGIVHLRENHIVLLFVHDDFHGEGIGSFIIDWVKSVVEEHVNYDTITVNSSPNSIVFYQKQGFKATDDEQNVNGILFTPMILHIKK